MIMIRAIIHIFSSYMIFDQQLKITFRKSSAPPPPEKIHYPLFTHSPPKKVNVPPFCQHWKLLRPLCRKGGGQGEAIMKMPNFFRSEAEYLAALAFLFVIISLTHMVPPSLFALTLYMCTSICVLTVIQPKLNNKKWFFLHSVSDMNSYIVFCFCGLNAISATHSLIVFDHFRICKICHSSRYDLH